MEEIRKLKLPKSFDEQLEILLKHNMIIEDRDKAIDILNKVNYYRFNGYALRFKKNNRYIDGTTFGKIHSIYQFDKSLRHSLMEALEIIEISLRTSIEYNLAQRHGSEAHLNQTIFVNKRYHAEFVACLTKELERNSKELFVKHHIINYNNKFPIWVVLELSSFGTLSKMYKNLVVPEQKVISKHFCNLNYSLLTGGIYHLSYVRNICAHHSRIYDKNLRILPKLHKKYDKYEIDKTKIFASILVIKEFLLYRNKTEWDMFHIKIESLIEAYQGVINLDSIGFKPEWREILNL